MIIKCQVSVCVGIWPVIRFRMCSKRWLNQQEAVIGPLQRREVYGGLELPQRKIDEF